MKAKALFFRVFIAVATVVLLLSVSASARVYSGKANQSINWEFDLNTGSMTITGSGKMPDYLNYASTPWSEYMLLIKKLTVSKGITGIGNCSFMHARFLESVTLPIGIKTIGDSAFEYCTSLSEINFPDGITSFGSMSFASCSSLKNISLPDSTNEIGSYAFSGTAVRSLTLTDNIETIGEGAFSYCDNLSQLKLECSDALLSEGIFYSCKNLESIDFSDDITSLGKRTFFGCENLDSVLPSHINADSSDIFFGSGINFGVTWIVDGTKTNGTVKYGNTPEFSGSTKKNSALDGIYSFTGWSKPLEKITVSGENIYCATYEMKSLLTEFSAQYNDVSVEASCNISMSDAADKSPYIIFSCYTESGEMISCKRVSCNNNINIVDCSLPLRGRIPYKVTAAVYSKQGMIPISQSAFVLA